MAEGNEDLGPNGEVAAPIAVPNHDAVLEIVGGLVVQVSVDAESHVAADFPHPGILPDEFVAAVIAGGRIAEVDDVQELRAGFPCSPMR